MRNFQPVFMGEVAGGKVVLADKEMFKIHLAKMEGKQVGLTVVQKSDLRTNSENRYYWGVIVDMVGFQAGLTPDEAHELLKSLFLKKGIEAGGKRYEIAGSTASLSVAEFEEYCEKCREWSANELGCPIPLPGEIMADLQ